MHAGLAHFGADYFITICSMGLSSVASLQNEELFARIRRRRGSTASSAATSENSSFDALQNLVVQVNLESVNVPGIEQLWSIHGAVEQTFVVRSKDRMRIIVENVTPKEIVDDVRIEGGMVFVK